MKQSNATTCLGLSVVFGLLVAAFSIHAAGHEKRKVNRAASSPPQTVISVPPGFEALELIRGPEKSAEIRTWGRRYLFRQGPLPTEIYTLESSLFSESPKLQIALNGRPVEIMWEPIEVVEASARQVVLGCLGRLENSIVEAKTTIAFDGMVHIALVLRADRPLRVDTFAYEFRFPASVARHFNHHLDYDYSTMRVKRGELLETAGLVPKKPIELRFVPSFSIGNREIGFEWWGDSDRDWKTPKKTGKPIRLSRQGETVALSIAPISLPYDLDAGAVWQHEFAIFALPMRRVPDRVHSNRFLPPKEASRYRSSDWLRFYAILFPGQFSARWHGLPEAIDDPAQRRLRKRLENDGIGYIPYAKLTAAPSLHPKVMAMAKQWSATGKMFTGPAGGEKKFMSTRGWKPGSAFSYAVCMRDGEYLDWMLDEVLSALRDESLNGLYFDWGSIMEPCRRPADGSLSGWGYFKLREFYLRLYEAVKSSRPDVLLTIHTHGQPRALGAYVDYVFVGEALNVPFRGSSSLKAIRKNPGDYKPHYMDLPEGFLEAQVFPRIGGTTGLLPEVHFARDKAKPEREVSLTRELFAETILNGIPVWQTNCDVETRIAIMKALDQFGNLDDATMYPWWIDPLSVENVSGVRATSYSAGGTGLFIVSNRNSAPVRALLRPNLVELGINEESLVYDPEVPESAARVIAKDGIPVEIPAHDFRLLLIR
jgi:hypothetical protein